MWQHLRRAPNPALASEETSQTCLGPGGRIQSLAGWGGGGMRRLPGRGHSLYKGLRVRRHVHCEGKWNTVWEGSGTVPGTQPLPLLLSLHQPTSAPSLQPGFVLLASHLLCFPLEGGFKVLKETHFYFWKYFYKHNLHRPLVQISPLEKFRNKWSHLGTSLMLRWLRFCTPYAGGLCLIPGQGLDPTGGTKDLICSI